MCTSKAFTVAGLQAGNECWCGVSYGSKGRGTGCPCTTEQGGKATRAADSLLTLTCVYGEECCTENTAKCGACKHGMAEWQFCMLAGTDMPGCDIYCAAHPEIEGCKGGTCYRNEQSFSCQSTCPSGMRRVRYIDNWWPACDELICEEEYACEVSESKEICDYSDEDTNAIWSFEYFVKYGHFPHPAQQTLFEEIMASEGMEWLDIVLKEGVDTATGDFGEILKITSKLGANAGIARMTVLMAARSVAQLSTARATGRGITGAGQVLFRRALHGFWDGAARHMTHHHLKTAASVGVTLGLAVATTTAEIVAGQLVSLIGFENKQIEAAAGLLASIAAGALIGSSGADWRRLHRGCFVDCRPDDQRHIQLRLRLQWAVGQLGLRRDRLRRGRQGGGRHLLLHVQPVGQAVPGRLRPQLPRQQREGRLFGRSGPGRGLPGGS